MVRKVRGRRGKRARRVREVDDQIDSISRGVGVCLVLCVALWALKCEVDSMYASRNSED